MDAKKILENSVLNHVDVIAKTTNGTKEVVKTGVKEAFKLTESSVSTIASQVNKYTPDIYDVGNRGQNDLTQDMSMFALGNSAMITQNAVRMTRSPISKVLKIGANVIYSEKRIKRLLSNKNAKISANPNLKFSYVEIATGKSRKDILQYSDRLSWNRFKKNTVSTLSVGDKIKLMKDKVLSNHYNRVLSNQRRVLKYAQHLDSKKFNLIRSTKNTIKNQTRKASNQIINGNDANSMTNKTMFYANKGFRGSTRMTTKTIISTWKNRKKIMAFTKNLKNSVLHPIQTLKNIGHALINLISFIGSVLSTIPVILSLVIMLLPVIIVTLCIIVIVTVILNLITAEPPLFSYVSIVPCDTANETKNYVDISSVRNSNVNSYDMIYNNSFGEVLYDDWGLAYLEQDNIRWYLVESGAYYGKIGTRLCLTLDSSELIHVIICSINPNAKHGAVWKDCLLVDDSMFRFYSKADEITVPKLQNANYPLHLNQELDVLHKFRGKIKKISRMERNGASFDTVVRFSNKLAWDKPSNPYANANLYGQCTWFAWGRFYEVYGYSPQFTGNGYSCVSELLQNHPTKFKFSTKPKAGSIGCTNNSNHISFNHVWFVENVEGNKMTLSHGNLNGLTDDWNTAITDWETITVNIEDFERRYGGNCIYAVPKRGIKIRY